MPEMPVNAAGWRIEPPVSVPVAPATIRAATAAEEPPLEPPGASGAVSPSERRQGEITLPKALVSFDEPMANRSEEHTSELQSLMRISYAVFCLKQKKKKIHTPTKTSTTKILHQQ